MSNRIYIARIVIETTSPLVIGAGKSDFDNDSVVAKDFNSLPYIPGEGLAGVISELFEKEYGKEVMVDIFGGEDEEAKKNKETLLGSSIEISSAYLVDDDKKGSIKQQAISKSKLSAFHQKFLNLPKREHVSIEYTGTAKKGRKFDNEFVFKGSRFKFEIVLNKPNKSGYDDLYEIWKSILDSLYTNGFILGSGTTNGYGQIKVISIDYRDYDLGEKDDFLAYLNYSADLNAGFEGAKEWTTPVKTEESEWVNYQEYDFETKCIHIGAGYGDMDVDDTNYKEQVITWDENNKPQWKPCFVIPGSAIKGDLSHRVAFYSNNSVEDFIAEIAFNTIDSGKEKIDADFNAILGKVKSITKGQDTLEAKKKQLEELIYEIITYKYQEVETPEPDFMSITGENNPEVKAIFGFASVSEKIPGRIGNLIVDDVYIDKEKVIETKFDHNAIDRFTGGTIDTAIYAEKVFTPKNAFAIKLKIAENNKAATENLEKALDDLTNGNLPVGGKTNKGYGFLNLAKNQ